MFDAWNVWDTIFLCKRCHRTGPPRKGHSDRAVQILCCDITVPPLTLLSFLDHMRSPAKVEISSVSARSKLSYTAVDRRHIASKIEKRNMHQQKNVDWPSKKTIIFKQLCHARWFIAVCGRALLNVRSEQTSDQLSDNFSLRFLMS